MKTFTKAPKLLLLVIMLGLSCQGFATQDLKMSYDKSQASDNYYVPAGGVYVAPEGIFVMFEGDLVEVGMLCSDQRGVFVPGSEMSRRFVWCSICQRWYDPDRPHKCK